MLTSGQILGIRSLWILRLPGCQRQGSGKSRLLKSSADRKMSKDQTWTSLVEPPNTLIDQSLLLVEKRQLPNFA